MKQFSLEEYLKNPNKKVVTRGGLPVRIICTDRNYKLPIIALIKEKDGTETIHTYNTQGGFWANNEFSNMDLMFASIKKEGWVNLYESLSEVPHLDKVYSSKEAAEAIAERSNLHPYITTIKIEWEE